MKAIACAVSIAALGLGACAIHPIPNEVVGFNTAHIVRKIRCEARKAYIDSTIIGLRHIAHMQDRNNELAGAKKDNTAADNLEKANGNIASTSDFDLSEKGRKFVEKYDNTDIIFDFELNMTENNDLTSEFSFSDIISRGTFTPTLKSDLKRSRANQRAFRISDSPKTLLGALSASDCAKLDPDLPNPLYPIGGNIGLFEVFSTFLELAQHSNLAKSGEERPTPYLLDTLTFTTSVSGTVTPKVTLSPLGKQFSLASAEVSATAGRSDVHKVVVALAINETDRRISPARRPNMAEKAIRERKLYDFTTSLEALQRKLN